MARMIPAYITEDSSPGEKALFRVLASSTDTDDWVVLHSLGIAKHVRNPEGEADFVVIVPDRGIVVIEVKSHLTASYEEGRWKLGNNAPTTRGPIRQASEAMHSLRNYLQGKSVDLRSIPMLSAAWFTAVRARSELPASPEWHHWQILDSEDLNNGAARAILRMLNAGTEHLDETFTGFSYGGVGPDKPTAQRIAGLLRPRFEVGITAGDLRRAREDQLTRFIDEQYAALDSMADNRTVLFTGPAGSGKTWLAVEAARREAEMGNQGRLICYNSFLGKRLTAAVSANGLTVGTLHKQLLDMTGLAVPEQATDHFWRQELPERALEVLIDADEDAAADFLIVDEVQDIACHTYLDVLELMVKGGLDQGRVLFFGDFERQAIFEQPDGRDLLHSRVSHLPSNRLTVNCRNRPRIGEVVNTFSRLEPGYRRYRRDDDGANPRWRSYQAGEKQAPKLLEAIHDLRDEGYELQEIVVLSPLRDGSVAETTDDQWLRQVLRKADGRAPRRGELHYSTIHAFKGLESPAVVLTDLDRSLVPNFESLLYVGLTRATDRLWGVIEKNTLRAEMERTL